MRSITLLPPQLHAPGKAAPSSASQLGCSRPGPSSEMAVAAEFLSSYRGNTQAAYAGDLRDFFRYCQEQGLGPLAVRRAALRQYLDALEVSGLSGATLARRLVTLRGFYAVAVDEFGLGVSPAGRLRQRRPRTQARIRALSFTELRRLLSEADTSDPRTRGLVWLLATTGLRISEACQARQEQIRVASGGRWLDVNCKGSVLRTVPLHAPCCVRLEPLLAAGSGPIFATRNGTALDRHAAARRLRALADSMGMGRVTPHVLRHTFVTLSRQLGCALEDVQDAVGHADPATTRSYDRTVQTADRHPGSALLAALATTQSPADRSSGG